MSLGTKLRHFWNRPAPTFHLRTAMKVKGISLIGVSVYALAKERTGDVVRGGKLNFGVVVKEGWEEWRDRWRGLDENYIDLRKQERREARKSEERERRERMMRMEEKKKRGIILLRWRWPRKPKD